MSLTVYDSFKQITGYDVRKYFSDFYRFTSTMYRDIVNYYNGFDIVQSSFNEFDRLVKESDKIESLLQFHSKRFENSEYWVLYDNFSNTQVKLSTINNLSRWMRSSRGDRFSSEISINYVLKQGESLERVSKKAGNELYDSEWYKIAVDNDLNEEKYTSAGGNILMVKLSNKLNFSLRNIVDTLTEENLYGKDIQKRFSLVNGDIFCLSGMESLMQTISTFFETYKGSIPEFPEDGLSNFIIGSNSTIIGYQYIFRNLLEMVQKDDRFKSITLIDLVKNEDKIFLKVQFTTKINDFIPKEIAL
jgi:hypothetical protein